MIECIPYYDENGCYRGVTIKEVQEVPNKCQIAVEGHLGRDTEVRTTNSGYTITDFSLAYSFGKDDKKQTFWWNCTYFGEFRASKGQAVRHEGYLRLTSYVNKAGATVHKMEIVTGKDDPAPYVIQGSAGGQQPPPASADQDFIDE